MEAIVLKTIPYAERDRIITLFSEQGISTCFVKLSRQAALTRIALTTPFTRGDYLIRKGRGSLPTFVDGTLIDQHLGLRRSLERLETAHQMGAALLTSQWPGQPSAALYALFAAFLKKVSESDQPLLIPFLIKLLKHEGAMNLDDLVQSERDLVLQTAEALSFDQFPPLPDSLKETIYSKVTGASATSI